MFRRLFKSYWPLGRSRALAIVFALSLLVSLIIGITSGPLAGITLLVGCSGLLSLTLLFFPAQPELIAELRSGRNASIGEGSIGLIIGARQTVRPLDIDQIVQREEAAARGTMPRAPTPRVPKGAFGGVFDLNDSTAMMLDSVSGASDEELWEFLGKVTTFGEELRTWLERLQAARDERLRAFSATVRVTEHGKAAADFARLALSFPAGFEQAEQSPGLFKRPTRPEFVGRFDPFLGRVTQMPPVPRIRASLSHLIPSAEALGGSQAEYSTEGDQTIVSLGIGHINQREYRDTGEFDLRAAPPGRYEIGWRAGANGVSPPAEGTIEIEVRAPAEENPITDLDEALKEISRHDLD